MESQKEQALHPLLLPLCVLVCGGAMIGVFRLLGKLDDSVLYGAALGCGICILNLFLLRFTMNRAAAATSPQAAQQIAKASVPPRLLLICVAFYLGFTLPVFNPIAVVVPFAFPRLSALLLQMFFQCLQPQIFAHHIDSSVLLKNLDDRDEAWIFLFSRRILWGRPPRAPGPPRPAPVFQSKKSPIAIQKGHIPYGTEKRI